jgi:hypothetical protein
MSTSDWDLGQKLIEQGACSLDQVREVLSLQDRMRKMGAAPKPFARVLLERGYARRDQLLKAGVAPGDLPPELEKPAPAPAAAPEPETPSTKPLVWTAVALVALIVLVLVGRGVFSGDPGETVYVPPPELTAEEIDAIAREELARIAVAANGVSTYDNAPEIVAAYENFKQARAGSKWEVEGHRRLKEYKELLEVHAKAELEDLLKGDPPLRDARRWVELQAHYKKFPAKFLETSNAGATVRQKLQEIDQRITEKFTKERAEASKLYGERKFPEALALLQSMEAWVTPERLVEIQGMRRNLEIASRGAAEKSRQEVADAYFKIDGAFKQWMLRRDGYRAALVIRDFLTAPWKEDHRPFVRVREVDYEAILKLFEPWDPEKLAALCEAAIPEVDSPDRLGTGEGALLALRNAAFMSVFTRDQTAQFHAATSSKQPLDLPSLGKGHFDKKDGKTVFITEVGNVLDPESHPLTELDLAALAMMVGPANAAMEARVGFFYFYSAPEQLKAAYEHLARAYTKGAIGVKLFLGGLAVVAEGQLKRELETKFGAAKDLYKDRKWPQVRKLLGDLLDFPDHPFTRSVRPEVEKMLYEIAEGSDKEKELAVRYKGKAEMLEGGLLRVGYDFEGKEQQDAFESVTEEGARRFKGRWRVERGGMESSTDASVMRWKTPVKGDVILEYDLTPVDEPQNIVLNLYYNKGETRHYAVVLGFDWVGRQDGDRDNSAEDRNGMPRSCVIKYPVTVDKSLWKERDPWDAWKARLAGKPAGSWSPKKGETARIRVERQGPSIRVHADKALIWEGQDDEYSDGRLLFYSDRRTRIDNLAITFKPQ